jgi:hypothetical protein
LLYWLFKIVDAVQFGIVFVMFVKWCRDAYCLEVCTFTLEEEEDEE